MSMKVTKAEFMGVSQEWLDGFEAGTEKNRADFLTELLKNVEPSEISRAMREYAEVVGEPSWGFHCGDECCCGRNCGEDDDCFACGDRCNLDWVWFGGDDEDEEQA